MKVFYEDTLIDNAEPKLVHDMFADKYPIPKNGGKTIEFRKYSPLAKATTPLTEGVTPAGNGLSVSAITSTVNQYGDYIKISDMLDLTAIDNNVVQATKLLGSQSGRTLDTITREIINAGTNVIFAAKGDGTEVMTRKTLDATCSLSVETIYRAAAQLESMNADGVDGESFVAIIHPYAAYDLMRSEEWIDVHKYAKPENIYKGELGKIGNVRFVKSTEAKIWKDDTCPEGLAVFSTLVVGARAYATTDIEGGGLQHIVKQLGYGEDPLNQRASVGWKATKTAEILTQEYMVRIESCSPVYSAKVNAN
jgi:N4-gp56 family major capsid protein